VLAGLPYVSRCPVIPAPSGTGSLEVEDYRAWIGEAKFLGELSLRGKRWNGMVVLMTDLSSEQFHDVILMAALKYVHESMLDPDANDALEHLNREFARATPTFFADSILRTWTISLYQSLLEIALIAGEALWASVAAGGLQVILQRR